MAFARASSMNRDITGSPIGAALERLDPISTLLTDDAGSSSAGDVVRFVEQLAAAFRTAALPTSPRLAVALPNGRPLALTALAAMSIATFAPLNPRLTEEGYVTMFDDLCADVLVSRGGFAPAAHAAAVRCGIGIIEIGNEGQIDVIATGKSPVRYIESDGDWSLLLHTSGTTARPKLIGLSGQNLMASASSVAATVAIGPDDRCLNVMPLFHIHGLVGVLLSSLVAGGSVHTTDRFDAAAFATQLRRPDITWTSAVPSAYNTLLLRGDRRVDGHALRFVRSSSAPLAPVVAERLERMLGCPVINSYGMTEASHQMASNPLPPRERRLGTVGLPAGAEVAVLSDGRVSSAPGASGEVVVNGPGLMAGYLAPAAANESAWHGTWFRTGDLGSLDVDGYLTLIGRIKEIINVAGEKVSPYEVEAAIREHPGVADVVAFGAPDRLRGEQVCVAVVVRPDGVGLSPASLRAFGAERLAKFMVPRQVIVVDEIPLGATGKVQRSQLAATLGLPSH